MFVVFDHQWLGCKVLHLTYVREGVGDGHQRLPEGEERVISDSAVAEILPLEPRVEAPRRGYEAPREASGVGGHGGEDSQLELVFAPVDEIAKLLPVTTFPQPEEVCHQANHHNRACPELKAHAADLRIHNGPHVINWRNPLVIGFKPSSSLIFRHSEKTLLTPSFTKHFKVILILKYSDFNLL